MSPEERKHIDDKFVGIEKMLAKIDRGVYGDFENKVPGLIDTDKQQHKRIKSLEDTRKKAVWVGAGIIAALELAWHGFKEWFHK